MQSAGEVYHQNSLIGSFIKAHENAKVQVYLNEQGLSIENVKCIVRKLVNNKIKQDLDSNISVTFK